MNITIAVLTLFSFFGIIYLAFLKKDIIEIITPETENKIIIKELKKRYLVRDKVNQEVELHIKSGFTEKVYKFYDQFTKNREITYLIVSNALIQKVPLHIAFSIGSIESSFRLSALGHNKDSKGKILSTDYGIYQLNSNTFKNHDKKYLIDIKNNIKTGIEYLAFKLKQKGNWINAIISYNRGSIIDSKGIYYYTRADKYERFLDEKFNLEF